MTQKRMLVVMSGGMDSTTLVYDALNAKFDVQCISFNYGQRHKRELDYAHNTCSKLKLQHDIVDLSHVGELLAASGSSLVSGNDVPEGHYEQENMVQTIVPNRNMTMMSVAAGIAISRGIDSIGTAVHAGDHHIYPDCRPEFIEKFTSALQAGNDEPITVWTPYVYKTKSDIATAAIKLRVPLHETWSCYKGEQEHCGRCGTCVERLESIHDAHLNVYGEEILKQHGYFDDSTTYQDDQFWKSVTKKGWEWA